ncbi:hypothetical protein FOE78_02120 [Microlunatus elymi]|uniref:Uncharacterized protein n=1 Tax=Microlunatus elymi TaxID=2596828 RepID=A0A516PUQ2_9ACTN|nr:hypothetical protein [Microlunatus elymi]QDP94873.1 hypothetical protein FOE78_02120 [Microlunatus elymi]
MADSDAGDDLCERSTEQEAQDNLRLVLLMCAAGELRCSQKTKRPTAATVRTVGWRLVGGDFYAEDPIAAFSWPLLIMAGGLARLNGSHLVLTAKGRVALNAPPFEVLRGLWQRWISHGLIDEFSRVDQIKGQRSANVLTAVKPRREVVARAVGRLPPGEWVTVDSLFARMRRGRLSPQITRSDRALFKLHVGHPEYDSFGYSDVNSWVLAEGRYTLAVLFEYAATLGLIDISYTSPIGARQDWPDYWCAGELESLSRYDGLTSVRLNGLGSCIVSNDEA